MFASLTAFLAPCVSLETRLAWTERGGRLAKYEMVREDSPEPAIDYWIGAHGQADELVDRLRVLGFELHDEQWIRACLEAGALVDAAPYRFSVLDQPDLDDRRAILASRRGEASLLNAQNSPRNAVPYAASSAPLMHVVPATPAGPTNAGPPVTPTRRSTFRPFDTLQALDAIPEDSPLSHASARTGHSRTSTMDSDIAVELYLLHPPSAAGAGPQSSAITRLSGEAEPSSLSRLSTVQTQRHGNARPDAFLAVEDSPPPQAACRPLHPLEELHERLTEGTDAAPVLPADLVFTASSSQSHHGDRPCLEHRQRQGFQVLEHAHDDFLVRRRDSNEKRTAAGD
ncbi:BRCT domain containing protein [Rhodotorula toruloides]|uniref:BY PROTMAP: gi/472588663/gb/EMS26135.1/ BRCT domain containing protein [Rhodosporidium toruloides NP11] gi/647396452/emb/CDR38670.1/ RHTO0S03e11958g1_1 [Rhodosporidium toruloides] n=1 Tax=Rhodotorula toruloides TaxID=5286 RepID=A0A0K3CRK5_RHOTO|nr:BRCT domain containing protein [Rhodotorula toruloides]PRQ69947.1 hypothetical protein AAT19DRAFT_11600 [Rhodotorula toruloides]